jgi:hypothetical protein
MAPDIDSPRAEPPIRWSGRVSLTTRILAVNVFALALLAGGFFYLESYRARLIDFRIARAVRELSLVDEAIAVAPKAEIPAMLSRMARKTGTRLRFYGADGRLQVDSWRISGPNYTCATRPKKPGSATPPAFSIARSTSSRGPRRRTTMSSRNRTAPPPGRSSERRLPPARRSARKASRPTGPS